MFAMTMSKKNMSTDASWFAPACQSAQSTFTATLSAILDTAIEAVSFLSLAVRNSLLGLVRIILREQQS